jgi:hypothetical protein
MIEDAWIGIEMRNEVPLLPGRTLLRERTVPFDNALRNCKPQARTLLFFGGKEGVEDVLCNGCRDDVPFVGDSKMNFLPVLPSPNRKLTLGR